MTLEELVWVRGDEENQKKDVFVFMEVFPNLYIHATNVKGERPIGFLPRTRGAITKLYESPKFEHADVKEIPISNIALNSLKNIIYTPNIREPLMKETYVHEHGESKRQYLYLQ